VLVAPRAGNPDTWAENDIFRLLLLFDFAKSYGRALPGFPVEFGGVGELHAAFLTESRTRGGW
jgi:hypothetical protein